ncbi:phage minor tail protein L [Burkholderia thailandensis]|uniref:phage minor tail protein L n=1 Tax=Burkholderia thailandensis TaxID=57975 RepID=UPI00137D7A80|nr:phage minor tail protein L [Burkholderia thailandensis]MCS6489743.1 phage minor tail protein L [Burkholderia thailandensis]MUV29114.1 phage minor tail protein L [Burkholderia thailandensis]MUV31422.1 phage minor tail protein L [Burkholderia thailandensis]WNO23866.1 tail tip assembly protein L [Burkholderia phage phiBtTUL1a]
MSVTADIQQLEPGRLIEFFEVDCTEIGADVLRFHRHLQSTSIVWQGREYRSWPIQATGFEQTSDAQQPSPTLRVGDINGTISALCVALGDLVGAKVFRRRTLARYLDAVNFPAGNPTADPNEEMPPQQWRIEQKSDEQPGLHVEFTLSSPLDFGGQQLPKRQIISICQWGYRGPECGYTGAACFDKDDNPVSDPALDRCSKKISGCERRFSVNNPLPIGGFLCDTMA